MSFRTRADDKFANKFKKRSVTVIAGAVHKTARKAAEAAAPLPPHHHCPASIIVFPTN